MKGKKEPIRAGGHRWYRYAAIFAICLLLLILGVGHYTFTVTKLLKRDTAEALGEVAFQTATSVRERLEDDLDSLTALAAALGAMGGPDAPEVHSFISRGLSDTGGAWLAAVNPEGDSYTSDGTTGNVREDELVQQILSGERVFSDARPPVLRRDVPRVVILAVPIRSGGEITGGLAAISDLKTYQEPVSFSLYGGKGSSCIMKPDGERIAWDEQGDFSLLFTAEDRFDGDLLDRLPELSQMRDDMASGQSGVLTCRRTDGEKVYLSYTPLEINDWYLVNQISTRIVETRKLQIRKLAVGVTVVVSVLFSLLLVAVLMMKAKQVRMIERIALFDPLTGLPNGQQMKDFFTARDERAQWAYLLLRIPDIRQLSTVFGYATGGNLLREVGGKLEAFLRPGELAARISEDRFALMLQYEEQGGLSDRVDRLMAELRQIQATDGTIVYDYHASFLGGAYAVEPEDDFAAADWKAAAVLLEPHPDGSGVFWDWFDHGTGEQISLQGELMPEIFRALQNREFIPYFQPLYDAATKEVVGAEVLARWQHPTKGVLEPNLFVPLLEAGGCILELDLVMFEQACLMIRHWLARGLLPVCLSVNISRLNIFRPDFFDRMLTIARRYDVPTNLISLELTETAIFENGQRVLALINRLKREGFLLAMDDFGTGYSSLNMLQQIPVDVIKLDQGFLRKTGGGERGRVVLRNVARMADELGASLIAEGVETPEQEALVREAGCRVVQGFLYSRPVAEEAFEAIIFPEE